MVHKRFTDDVGYVHIRHKREFELKMPLYLVRHFGGKTLNYRVTEEFEEPQDRKAYLSILDSMETYKLMLMRGLPPWRCRMVLPQAAYVVFTWRPTLADLIIIQESPNTKVQLYASSIIKTLDNI